jgi:UDP-4-amino-4,6-dideoxy-N-acetyl-beta-L-altrosamine N-acetyltransferase
VLRPATDSDTDDIRRWRNHPEVRAVSLTSHVITPEEHAAWFAAARTDPRRRILIFEYEGRPAGVVNFTAVDPAGAAMWGFFLDLVGLEERGETLPAWMDVYREAIAYAFGDLGLGRLDAEVLEHNTVIRRMNRRFGFVEGEPSPTTIDGAAVNIYPIHLSRADYESRARSRKEHTS